MNKQQDQMKWVLFWVFLILFTMMVLGTLAMVFLGFGSPTESEREIMVKGLIGEVAACIVALFYSIFGLKGNTNDNSKIQELEDKTDQILLALESYEKIEKHIPSKPPELSSTSEITEQSNTVVKKEANNQITLNDFESKIKKLKDAPPFPLTVYELDPLPEDIRNNLKSTKPFDLKHRKEIYNGMKIQWKALLATVSEIKDNKLQVTADVSDSMLNIVFEIENRTSNKFKLVEQNEPFWVCGEIKKASSYEIELVDVQIQFQEQA
ncbi:hypothetical protein [Psychromonas aquimarina]|uniref:hypothetical protein n=1 Tax=Psychromonas aquimarina TaxID=444919 RepID=UPI000425291F|nr:hypothetical protein [Psychromonas aquimarina]